MTDRRRRMIIALAAAFYLALALWSLRVVLPAPASTFPMPNEIGPLARLDRRYQVDLTNQKIDSLIAERRSPPPSPPRGEGPGDRRSPSPPRGEGRGEGREPAAAPRKRTKKSG